MPVIARFPRKPIARRKDMPRIRPWVTRDPLFPLAVEQCIAEAGLTGDAAQDSLIAKQAFQLAAVMVADKAERRGATTTSEKIMWSLRLFRAVRGGHLNDRQARKANKCLRAFPSLVNYVNL